MKTNVRLDKYLADLGKGTRTEVKKYIRDGRVSIDGVTVTRPETKVSPDQTVFMDGRVLHYEPFHYYLMHKPAGVICATRDGSCRTVLDLIEEKNRKQLFPVGRLDKDTTGLLLITDDGDLAHRLLSPRWHVPKTYLVQVEGRLNDRDTALFAEGMEMEEDWTTLPADLIILQAGSRSLARVTIREGKYHQIKRMFEKIGKPVLSLKRISMGPLTLPDDLAPGAYRPLTQEEYQALMERKGNK